MRFMANNAFPDPDTVEQVKKRYPAGCRVELIQMDDPYTSLKPGDQGAVSFVDDTGTIFVD